MIRRLLLSLSAAATLFAAAPTVAKVEPPNWWAGHSINPVRLLIRGSSLAGARLEAAASGLTVGNPRVNNRGTYLFADVSIPPEIPAGPRTLRVVTAEGAADVPFEISRPLDRSGRFQGFSPDDLIYLIMPDRFANGDPSNDDPAISRGLLDRGKTRYYHGGDFQGIIDHLPYLKSLSVTALWINPWYDNNNGLNRKETYDGQPITDYHGYGAIDFYGVEEHLGTMAKLRDLVESAHRLGIKVIQDQVANHTGPYHPWVDDSPTSTWYNGTAQRHLANTWQTWTLADPHSPPEMRRATLDGWFIDILPDLNQGDPETARYLIQNTLWWVGVTGIDGIRQDTWPYVPRAFWRDWMSAIKREYPALRVVGEVFDGDPALVSFFAGGREQFDGIDTRVDSLFDFPLFYAIRDAFARGRSVRAVAQSLSHDRLYPDALRLVTFLGLHDVNRFMAEQGATIDGLKLAWTFLMTTRGIPMIYYGDEIGMPGGNDPDNRRDFPGGWPGDPRNAFQASGRTPDQQAAFAHVQSLGQLRAAHESLRHGTLTDLVATEQQYVFQRSSAKETAIIVLNNATAPAAIDAGVELADTTLGNALTGAPSAAVSSGRLRVSMPARSSAVYFVPTAVARNSPAVLPGAGLSAHDFFYAGEAKAERMFIVRGGKVAWSYTHPGKGEISDAVLLPSGNILFAHQYGITEISGDGKVVWNYDAPAGTEIHTAQPIGRESVLFVQNGDPAKVVVVNKGTGAVERSFTLPVSNANSVHGQFRRARLTPSGTLLVAHMDMGKVVEYDPEGKPLWSVDAPSAWSASPLANGNVLIAGGGRKYVREVDRTGGIVWEFTPADAPGYELSNIQTATRLANGNTLINNWFNEWSGSVDLSNAPVQAIEVAPDKRIVWVLRSWTGAEDLGPSTTIQLLDRR